MKLRDEAFDDSHVEVQVDLLSVHNDEGMKLSNVRFTVTAAQDKWVQEMTLFNDDVVADMTSIGDYFFTDPDVWLTIVAIDEEQVVLYVNFDAGESLNKIVTESGRAVRLSTTRAHFEQFKSELAALIS
jgi:hypothetical protein